MGLDDSTPPEQFHGMSPPVEGGGPCVGELPAVALGAEAQVLQPHRLVPAEGHVDLGHVEVPSGVGDPGLGVDVGRAFPAGPGVHLVPPGEHGGLRAHGHAVDPGRSATGGRLGLAGRLLRAQHHGRRPVRGRAGLEVADGVPQHDRLLDHLEGDVGDVEVGVGVLEGLLAVLHRHQDPDVRRGARAAHVGPDDGGRSSPPAPASRGAEKGWGTDRAHMASESDCFSKATVEHPLVDARGDQVGGHQGRRPAHRPGGVHPEHGLAHRAQRRGQVELGHHDALEHVGGLADDHGVDVGPVEAGVLERPHGRLADQAGDGDVLPLGLCLVWPTPITAHRLTHQFASSDGTPGSAAGTDPRWRGRPPGWPSRP